MEAQHHSKLICVLAAAGVLATSGCATAFVRSKNTVDPQHVFPATAFDGEFVFEAGLKGEPLFAPADPKARNSPPARVAFCVGAIIDLPFSVVFDTILLPADLFRARAPAEDEHSKAEPDAATSGS